MTSSWQRLPIEVRLHILSFTHLGAHGDSHDEHYLVHHDHGTTFYRHRDLSRSHVSNADTGLCATSCRCQILPIDIFLVSRWMYQDALQVVYHDSSFTFTPAYKPSWDIIQRLPLSGTRLIRSLKLRASMADADIIFQKGFWNTEDIVDTWPTQQWRSVLEFIRDNFDLPKLCISVDLTMLERWRLNEVAYEKMKFAVYKYYRFLTSILCMLKTVKDVRFEMVWAGGLAPWMRREILGERFQGEVKDPDPISSNISIGGVPYWHQNDKRVRGSNFCDSSF